MSSTNMSSEIPIRRIYNDNDLSTWVRSKAYKSLINFINDLNLSIENKEFEIEYPTKFINILVSVNVCINMKICLNAFRRLIN